MNSFTVLKKKIIVRIQIFYILLNIMHAFTLFKLVSPHRFNYTFICNEKTEILIYREKLEEETFDEVMNEEYELLLSFSVGNRNFYDDKPIFTYGKENNIQFDVLNNILEENTSETNFKCGKIQCSYELSYFLRLSRDITELPNYFNNYQLKCMLTTLKYLKAIENKNIVKFFIALVFNDCNCDNINESKKNNVDFEYITWSDFITKIDRNMITNLLSGFMSFLMIEFVFNDGNLILLENTNDYYDILLFDKNIPFKHLLINKFKTFFALENILKNPRYFSIFRVLLDELNLKSLIINNYQASEILDVRFPYYVFSMLIFKSMIVSNITTSYIFVSYLLFAGIDENIEFLSLKNIKVSTNDLNFFLKKQKLKGLVLDTVKSIENSNIIDDCVKLIETLEFVDFRNIDINYNWWKCFFLTANATSIILFFDTLTSQENFLNGLAKLGKNMNLVRLKIMFFDFEISESFCYSLRLLNHLKNLKLLNYQTNKKSEISLFKAIKSLKELKNLAIQNPKFCKTPCNIFLKSKNIKVLCLENIFSNEKTQLLASLFSFTFITKFFLTNIFITYALLVKIFKMKHLIQLSLKFCAIESIMFPKPLDFSARNIKFLNIYDTNWNNLQYFDILGKLDNIEFLDISLCGLSASYLKNLSPGCNLKLKSVSCESGILDIDDLNIIGKLEIIEELNLSNCVFHNSGFFKLGENCKFLNSLKNLDLMFVDISIEDLNFIRKFKNLKNLSLTLSGLNLLCVKKYIVSLHLNHFITNNIPYDENFKSLLENLNEININND
ncbi:hypothetical protein CWI37_0643p0020 [Hamiltosporidium tvaerminnensis]|uniref:Uncharacterized protein n=1 Tax=Hamiltosporidium tvaerminnensis TaxID=1176355 RepID=A0A4Q9L2P7_9MICR|nr:hypothetical protein CWI37_0643p0020 [Hamiltosporidium tvaerminnensis]